MAKQLPAFYSIKLNIMTCKKHFAMDRNALAYMVTVVAAVFILLVKTHPQNQSYKNMCTRISCKYWICNFRHAIDIYRELCKRSFTDCPCLPVRFELAFFRKRLCTTHVCSTWFHSISQSNLHSYLNFLSCFNASGSKTLSYRPIHTFSHLIAWYLLMGLIQNAIAFSGHLYFSSKRHRRACLLNFIFSTLTVGEFNNLMMVF